MTAATLNTPARLIRPTAARWTHECEQEALRGAKRVEFHDDHGTLTASFYNGPYLCFTREWRP